MATLLVVSVALGAVLSPAHVDQRIAASTEGALSVATPSVALRASGTVVGTSVTAVSWAPVVTSVPPPLAADDVAPGPPATAGDTVIEAPPAVFDEVALPAGAPPAPLVQPGEAGSAMGAGTWAVSIGIDDYPGQRHDLRSAVADAVEVDRALAGYGIPGDQRLLLTDRAASAQNIERSLEWLVGHAGPEANVVFFYAGHVRKVSESTEAIVAADGATVLDERVAELLAPLAAPKAWIAIAACFGGGFTEVLAPGRILTAAASADDLAYENLDFGRSYLVEYMVRQAMVEGAASESVESAFAYAEAALAREHPDRAPVQLDQLDGDLVLASPSAMDRPAPRAQPEPSAAPPPAEPPPADGPPSEEPTPDDGSPEPSGRCLGAALRAIRCDD